MILFEYMTDMIDFHAQRITVEEIHVYFKANHTIKEREYDENDFSDRMFYDAGIQMKADLDYKFLKVAYPDISYEEVLKKTQDNAEMRNILKPAMIVSLYEIMF